MQIGIDSFAARSTKTAGVGGTPKSLARAGALGLPLMVAIIGGEPRRFRSLIDRYRQTGKEHGHVPERRRVGAHLLGYVAGSTQEAADAFYPGYAKAMTDIGKERGWPPMTRAIGAQVVPARHQ